MSYTPSPVKWNVAVRIALGDRDGWQCRYCWIALVPLPFQAHGPDGERAGGEWAVYGEFGAWRLRPGIEWPCSDHVYPRSLGGADVITNIALCCAPCNSRKGGRLTSELPVGWSNYRTVEYEALAEVKRQAWFEADCRAHRERALEIRERRMRIWTDSYGPAVAAELAREYWGAAA